MDAKASLVVKVLWKFISLICFRAYLEVNVYKNPMCFSRWSVRKLVTVINDFIEGYDSNEEYKQFCGGSTTSSTMVHGRLDYWRKIIRTM